MQANGAFRLLQRRQPKLTKLAGCFGVHCAKLTAFTLHKQRSGKPARSLEHITEQTTRVVQALWACMSAEKTARASRMGSLMPCAFDWLSSAELKTSIPETKADTLHVLMATSNKKHFIPRAEEIPWPSWLSTLPRSLSFENRKTYY